MTITPAWFYDELQQVGVDFENRTQVEAYDRNQGSNAAAERALLQHLGISADHTVIELGTGTGEFAVQAAISGAHVHAVDVSQAMLTYARQTAHAAGALNIEFHLAGFLTYEHRAAPADFIVTKAALHHLPDFWKMVGLLRMASMLKTGGIFYLRDAVFSFEPTEYRSRIDAWINQKAKLEGEGFTKNNFEMHVREEHSTFGWVMEGMLTRTGFEIEAANYIAPEYAEFICRKVGVPWF